MEGRDMRAVWVLLVAGSLLAGCSRDPGPKGDAGPQGPAGPQGAPGPKGDAGTSPRAVQADGAVACDSSEMLVSVFCPSGGAPDGAKCSAPPTIGLCMKKP